jgi:prevent-host-death family protein
MRRATITEAKNGLSALLEQVKSGESILITDRGVPVARLEPARSSEDDDDRLRRLERAGIVRRGSGDAGWIVARPPVPVTDGPPISDYVLDERETGW